VDSLDLTKPVESAALDLTGDTAAADTSDVNGEYAFANVVGDVTLDGTRVADANDLDALSSQDASEIGKYSVGLVLLSPRQLVAGDVSNNGNVTSFDASLVAQKVVNPAVLFPVATANVSDWAFFDLPQDFLPISGDETANDLAGVVYGDVTLNWTPPSPSRAVEREGVENLAPVMPDMRLRPYPARLYLAAGPKPLDDGSWELLLGISGSDGIQAMDFKLGYDPQQVTLLGAEARGLAAGMQVISHDNEDGKAAVALYGVEALGGAGELISLRVRFEPGAEAGFPFSLRIEANEGLIPVIWGADLQPAGGHRRLPDIDASQSDDSLRELN
jgi:hypothetical protein